jgi:hypothetical protein
MRNVIIVKMKVPAISVQLSTDIMEKFGIGITKNGFYGLPEDLDYFFAQEVRDELEETFNQARDKWIDGDIEYLTTA